MNNIKTPSIVRIIAFIYQIGFIFGIMVFLAILILGVKNLSFLGAFANVGILLMVLSLVSCSIMSRSLYRGKNWARILQIVFSILSIISFFFHLSVKFNPITIISLLLNITIIYYFLFDNKVKAFFTQGYQDNISK